VKGATRAHSQAMSKTPLDATSAEEEALAPEPRRISARLSFAVAVLGLVVCAWLLWDLWPALRYWLSTAQPVDLGAPGSYRLDRSADGLYARIEGAPGPHASRFRKLGTRYEIVALKGTDLLVRRALDPLSPPALPGRPEPPPDPAPFIAQGRLVLDRSIPEYSQAFQQLVAHGDAEPRGGHLYVLLDGERPRAGARVPAEAAGLLALAVLNAAALARYAARSRRRSGAA